MKNGRKLLAIILVICMAMSLLPIAAFAAPEDLGKSDQILGPGGVKYWDEDGDEVRDATGIEDEDVVLSTSKTLRQPDGLGENEFIIDLEVQTTVDVAEIEVNMDAATVLVIDISGSMAWCLCKNSNPTSSTSGHIDGCPNKSRLVVAKDAAADFLTMYANSETAARWMSVVTFSENASVIYEWTDVSISANEALVRKKIGDIGMGDNATNIDAGLALARNLMRTDGGYHPDTGIINNSVILLSDGAPNYSAENYTVSTNPNFYSSSANATTKASTTFHRNGSNTVDGETRSRETAASRAAEVKAASFRDSSGTTYNKKASTLYTIAFSVGVSDNTKTWLNDSIASSAAHAFIAGNSSSLIDAFDFIGSSIAARWASAWRLTDPMGTNIIFNGEYPTTTKTDPVLTISGGTISWDLKNDESAVHDSARDVWTYKYSYKITLDNLTGSDYLDGLDTNGETILTYLIEDSDGALSDYMEADLKIPSVKGFNADIEFTKINENGVGISGVKFNLVHADTTKTYTATATSDENGLVKFTDIPSGHTYKITEDASTVGADYVADTTPITATISYGEVTLSSESANLSAANKTFTNPFNNADLTIAKADIDGVSAPFDFKVTLFGNNGAYTPPNGVDKDKVGTDTILT